MSGHSKWSKVKQQKKTTDAVKSQAFTRASRAITVAVREGGGIADPEKNFRLRLAIDQAHAVNMPKENIERAMARATDVHSALVEQIMYEGYGPGGIALMVDAATDNRQRTASHVKHLFDRAGGSIGSPGTVGYQFVRCGILVVEKGSKDPDTMLEAAIHAGADDVVDAGDMYEIYTPADGVAAVKDHLAGAGWTIDNWEIIMKPSQPAATAEDIRRKNEELIEALEALEDVQRVYSNLE